MKKEKFIKLTVDGRRVYGVISKGKARYFYTSFGPLKKVQEGIKRNAKRNGLKFISEEYRDIDERMVVYFDVPEGATA